MNPDLIVVLEARYSYEDIAKEMGISVAKVMQIEKAALRKLKDGMRRFGVHYGDFTHAEGWV